MADDPPPVPVGPQYPGGGEKIRLRISKDGLSTSLLALGKTPIDNVVGGVVGRVVGMLVAGRKRSTFQGSTIDCWVRESRPGFLKIEVDATTIVCASTLTNEWPDRLLNSIMNTHRLSGMKSQQFSFVPIEKAGISMGVMYYIETLEMPDYIFPDLISESVRLIKYLIFDRAADLGIRDANKYLEVLSKGDDPKNVVAFEPLFKRLLSETPPEQRKEFVAQVGEQIRVIK
jgi:hypothetical protein